MDKQVMMSHLLAGKVLHGTTERSKSVIETGAAIGGGYYIRFETAGGYYIRFETAGGYRGEFHKDTCEKVVSAVFSIVGPNNDVVAINAVERSLRMGNQRRTVYSW